MSHLNKSQTATGISKTSSLKRRSHPQVAFLARWKRVTNFPRQIRVQVKVSGLGAWITELRYALNARAMSVPSKGALVLFVVVLLCQNDPILF